MALSSKEAMANIRRALGTQSEEELAQHLMPRPVGKFPLPPSVPAHQSWDGEALEQRRALLKEQCKIELHHLTHSEIDPRPEALQGNIENYIGMARIPVGVVGPLRVCGTSAQGDFYVPLATSEGALIASYNRGCKAISLSGGATAILLAESLQRTPSFRFADLVTASRFVIWAMTHLLTFQEIAASKTHFGKLVEMRPQMDGSQVTLILEYTTGDAAGQNMITFCTAEICKFILENAPFKPMSWYVEGNLSGDKKATSVSFTHVRGKKVTAEVHLSPEVLHEVLRTSAEQVVEYWTTSALNGIQSGSIGVNGHFANGLAALFTATGQDIACVAECAVGTTRCERLQNGGLYASVTLPNLIVGTIGGGTRLPTAQDALGILGLHGEGSARKLAEVCAAMLLGGELSIIAALSSGGFASAHEGLGRHRDGNPK